MERVLGSRKRILFLCYGNSCRSQMAEAWARYYGRGAIEPLSAGFHPLGYITEETEQVMAERGVTMDGQSSKGLGDIDTAKLDTIVNLSGLPLPAPLACLPAAKVDWPVDDPFGEELTAYRRVRDEIERRVKELIATMPHQPARKRE